MTLVLRYAARSDRGLVRSNNQDSVYAGPRLLAIADGMGGHAAGEVASKVMIAALAPLDDDEPSEDLLGQLREAVLTGNEAIAELVAGDPDLDGMGTTVTGVLFAGSRMGLVHVGDSRAYLFREGVLNQITHDDTVVQSLIDEGRITPEEAATHPHRSFLLRALTGHEVEPSLGIREARPGDRYLLCSDGLSGVVSHETLTDAMRISDPRQVADRLIELALKGGGPDNVTVIVADVVNLAFGENAPIVGGAAGDGVEEPQPDSAAARASATTRPRPAPTPTTAQPAPEPPRRRRTWLVAFLVGILVMLVGGVIIGWELVMRQYYVGVNSAGEVAIFQGLRGPVLGATMNRQVQGSCQPEATNCEKLMVTDLNQVGRETVRRGIDTPDGLGQAESKINELRAKQVLPNCPLPTTTAPAPPAPTSPAPLSNGAPPPPNPTSAPPAPTGESASPSPPVEFKPGETCRKVN